MTFGDEDRIGTVTVRGKSADVIVYDAPDDETRLPIQVIPMRDIEENVPYLVAIPREIYEEIEQLGKLEYLQLAITNMIIELLYTE